jgi:hypothetical protein
MQEEDYKVLRNEADANPAAFTAWDPRRQFRSEYAELHKNDASAQERIRAEQAEHAQQEAEHPMFEAVATLPPKEEEEVAPLSRLTSASSSSSSATSNSTHSARLEEIRTAQSVPARERATTVTSQASSGNILHLHPTERNPEAIRRIETHRSQHAGTVGTAQVASRLSQTLSRRRTERPLPSLGAGKPYPPQLPDREEYVVEFDGADDPLHAQNWPMKKKLGIGAILAFDALAATMGSSIFSAATRPVSQEFGVIMEVSTLGTSLFVFGYAFGPLVCPHEHQSSPIQLMSPDLGPLVRTLRPQTPYHHRRLRLLHLQHRRRRRQRSSNRHDLPLLRRPLRLQSARHRRRRLRRHVQQLAPWSRCRCLLCYRLHGPAACALHRRLHYQQLARLALDRVH